MMEEKPSTNAQADSNACTPKGTEVVCPQQAAPLANSQQNLSANPSKKQTHGEVESTQALLVEIVKDDALKPFEKRTLRLAWAGVLVGIITGIVFFYQFREMQHQTKILSEQAKQAATDSIEAGKRIDRQLDLAGKQADALKEQADNLASLVKAATISANVQNQVAKPLMDLSNELGVYHSEKFARLWAIVRVQNDGDTDAQSISVAARVEFRTSRPTESEYEFRNEEFHSTTPNVLPRFATTKKTADSPGIYLRQHISPENRGERFYVWGKIRFQDTQGKAQQSIQFCRHTSGNAIWDSPAGIEPGDGRILEPENDCKYATDN